MADWGASSGGWNSIDHYNIREVIFSGATMTFYHLEAESSLAIQAVTRDDDRGMKRIVGYRLILTLYIPNNNYKDHLADLEALRTKNPLPDLDVIFSGYDSDPITGNPPTALDIGVTGLSSDDKKATLVGMACTGWNISTIERRPRLILTCEALYSVKLFQSTIAEKLFI